MNAVAVVQIGYTTPTRKLCFYSTWPLASCYRSHFLVVIYICTIMCGCLKGTTTVDKSVHSVESICRDIADTQYMLKSFHKNRPHISLYDNLLFIFKCFPGQEDSQYCENTSRKYRTRKSPNRPNRFFLLLLFSLFFFFFFLIVVYCVRIECYQVCCYKNE